MGKLVQKYMAVWIGGFIVIAAAFAILARYSDDFSELGALLDEPLTHWVLGMFVAILLSIYIYRNAKS